MFCEYCNRPAAMSRRRSAQKAICSAGIMLHLLRRLHAHQVERARKGNPRSLDKLEPCGDQRSIRRSTHRTLIVKDIERSRQVMGVVGQLVQLQAFRADL